MVLMLVGSVNQREEKSWPAHEASLLCAWCRTVQVLHLSVLHRIGVGQTNSTVNWARQPDALCPRCEHNCSLHVTGAAMWSGIRPQRNALVRASNAACGAQDRATLQLRFILKPAQRSPAHPTQSHRVRATAALGAWGSCMLLLLEQLHGTI